MNFKPRFLIETIENGATERTFAATTRAIAALPDEPEHRADARWVYTLTKEQSYRAWPCDVCDTRRDEHADQVVGRFPDLDITDHEFKEW